MKSIPVLLLLSTLAAPAAHATSPYSAVPAGARVRIVSGAHHGTLTGTFVRAGVESLRVALPGGERTVAVPVASVRSFAFVSDSKTSPRKAALLGIGLGAVGGAALSIAAANAGEPGGGSAVGGGGGDRGPAFAPAAAAATAAAGTSPTGGSNAYRAVMGAVLGGVAGGIVGALTGLGMREDVWTSIPPDGGRAQLVGPAAPPVFAMTLRWPRDRGAHRR